MSFLIHNLPPPSIPTPTSLVWVEGSVRKKIAFKCMLICSIIHRFFIVAMMSEDKSFNHGTAFRLLTWEKGVWGTKDYVFSSELNNSIAYNADSCIHFCLDDGVKPCLNACLIYAKTDMTYYYPFVLMLIRPTGLTLVEIFFCIVPMAARPRRCVP